MKPKTTPTEAQLPSNNAPSIIHPESFADQVDYYSDHSSENENYDAENEAENTDNASTKDRPAAVPPQKRQKLDVPYRQQRKELQNHRLEERTRGLTDLEKLLKSKKTTFVGGEQGLQARHTRVITSHLRMVVRNGRQWADASERSAKTYGFAAKWGGRQLRGWSHH